MLHVVTGLFHPDLEQALASDLRSFTVAHPVAPCLILVPSEVYAPTSNGASVLRSASLFQRSSLDVSPIGVAGVGRTRPSGRRPSPTRVLFSRMGASTAAQAREDLVGLNELASMPGGWAALWATLKDLKDARVDAGAVLEAFSQTPFSTDRRLQSVIRLYQAWCDDQSRHSLYDHDDVAVLALDLVSASSWLRQQTHIFYYGFYDLTQGQLDLFQTIVRQYPATLYFPLLDQHPGFSFRPAIFRSTYPRPRGRPDRMQGRGCQRVSVSRLVRSCPSVPVPKA